MIQYRTIHQKEEGEGGSAYWRCRWWWRKGVTLGNDVKCYRFGFILWEDWDYAADEGVDLGIVRDEIKENSKWWEGTSNFIIFWWMF